MRRPTGEQIRRARWAKKLTLRAVAKELGVTAEQLSYVEHARSVLTDEQYEKAVALLSIVVKHPERGCVGYGPTYEAAIKHALEARRAGGWDDYSKRCRLVVDQHYVEPYLTDIHGYLGPDFAYRHVVVLKRLR